MVMMRDGKERMRSKMKRRRMRMVVMLSIIPMLT